MRRAHLLYYTLTGKSPLEEARRELSEAIEQFTESYKKFLIEPSGGGLRQLNNLSPKILELLSQTEQPLSEPL